MDSRLFDWLASVRNDPLAFVMGAFPWGQKGTVLEDFNGPMPWACELMERIKNGLITTNEAIQEAVASGHGVAKSATVAHIVMWAFMTFPDTRGVVTANTETQLKTKTWAELGKWFNLCWFAREHFSLTATALFSRDPDRDRTWRIDMIPWSEKNTEAFAGLHNKGKRLLLIMDEASAIPDIIWETAEGALTDADTQIIWLVFGNPTRNTGRFKECFPGGRFHEFWNCTQIDSRTVSITNKARLNAWIKVYGEDSDFVRIRVLGQFPRHGEMEFFSAAEVEAAMTREVYVDTNDPLVLGVDVARYGSNNSVVFPRKGRDARSIERRVFSGIGTAELADRIFEINSQLYADAIMIDGTGVGGGVVDNVRRKQLFCYDIQFGGKDIQPSVVWGNQGERCANNRTTLYANARAWMRTGAIPNDPRFKEALLAIRYTFNKKDEMQLVSKEDLLADNPDLILDDVDAFVCTFAHPVAKNSMAGGLHRQGPAFSEFEYNPFSEERMRA